ncbi:MAG: carboxypeptidase regulatory-like domain-containing protein [Candidatus Competibacteraceae bacterium]|nr:carboxypeptidase regulatory-like domain-containing protein [Candidatus Competibacteraceae bacterium]
MRRLTAMGFSVATLFLLLIMAVVLQNIASATAAASLTIGSNYSLVSSKRISSTVYEYVYRAQLTNSGVAANNVAATLTSTPQGVTVVEGALSFGNVAAGAVVSSSDTFTVRHDRQYPFNANALVWSTTFDPTFTISGYVTTAQGVTVTVDGPQTKSTVTDVGGVFSLEGLLPGQYTVSPTKSGSVFTPVRQTVTLINQDITGLVFVPQVPEETLSDEDIERIAATPSIFIPEDQVILPNGISLRDYLLMRGITITPGNSAIASASTHRSIQLGRAIAQSTLPPTTDPNKRRTM